MYSNMRVIVHISNLAGKATYEFQSIHPWTHTWYIRNAFPTLLEVVHELSSKGIDWNKVRFFTETHRESRPSTSAYAQAAREKCKLIDVKDSIFS